jgi:hypothetical protein
MPAQCVGEALQTVSHEQEYLLLSFAVMLRVVATTNHAKGNPIIHTVVPANNK